MPKNPCLHSHPAWQSAWASPAAADRPLQIVHEVDLAGKLPEGMNQLLPDSTPDGIARKGLEYYQQRGLGGLVCNVSFRELPAVGGALGQAGDGGRGLPRSGLGGVDL